MCLYADPEHTKPVYAALHNQYRRERPCNVPAQLSGDEKKAAPQVYLVEPPGKKLGSLIRPDSL